MERQNRRLKTAGIAVLVLAVAGLLMGQAMPTARTVEAEEFVLKGRAGMVRATLAVDKYGPGLGLFDEDGKFRVGLVVTKDGSVLALYDENENPRAQLNVDKNGARLALTDENRKGRILLKVDKDSPYLTLADENGKAASSWTWTRMGRA